MIKKPMAVLIISIIYVNLSYGYDNKKTHPDLTEMAVRKSILATSSLLKGMDLEDAIDSNVKGMKLGDWASMGADLEDAGSDFDAVIGQARFKNHFHDPLKSWPWTDAGLSDLQNGMSMVLWAQDSKSQSNALERDYSWHALRNYYYGALIGRDEQFREENFAKLFKGLGHQMHLIQDSAQPDHVRNDAHPLDGKGLRIHIGFEKWAKDQRGYINTLASSPIFPQVSLHISHDGLAPITQLIDTDTYTGSTPSDSLTQGLAEYANANFYTDDTIFAAERFSPGDKHYFPYPKMSSTNVQEYIDGTLAPEEYVYPDGSKEFSIWIKKERDGEEIGHLVRGTYFSRIVRDWFGDGKLFRATFYRDKACHIDYAQKLIPRAVGYSAALIDYFFRGKIDMVVNPSNPGQYVIKNESDEDMSGTFRLYYNDTNGNRKLVSEDTKWDLSIAANGTSSAVSFTPPTDAKEPGKYLLVFFGTQGAEVGAVVGKEVILQKNYAGRMAIMYDKYKPYVRLFTEIGIFNFSLPSDKFLQASAIRFDANNPNEFAVLVDYRGIGKTYQRFYLYEIDEKNKQVKFVENLLEYYDSPKPDDEYKFMCSGSFPLGGDNICYIIDLYSYRVQSEGIRYNDFFLKDRIIKPFGRIYSDDIEGFTQRYKKGFLQNGSCEPFESLPSIGAATKNKQIRGIEYGGPVEQVVSIRDDGYLDMSTGCIDASIHHFTGPEVKTFVPYVVLNENNYIFGHGKGKNGLDEWGLETSNSILLPDNRIGWRRSSPKIVSTLRKGEEYSFFTYNPYNYGTFPEKSYSSELGVVDCPGFLSMDGNVAFRITEWSTEVVEFHGCYDWKVLSRVANGTGDGFNTIFDVALVEY